MVLSVSPIVPRAWPNSAKVQQVPFQPDRLGEGLIFWTLVLVPVWWILGIQIVVYPLVGWYLLYRSLQTSSRPSVPFGWHIWGLYSSVWLVSIIYNLGRGVAELGRSVTALGSVIGIWFLALALWYAIRALNIRLTVIVRALCIVGLWQLLAVLVGESHIALTGSILKTQSLVTTLIPAIPARVFFDAGLYGLDDIGWDIELVPRLRSFYYWSPLAGTMSIIIAMAALLERKPFWRGAALLGSLVTVWLAAARTGQVGMALALILATGLGDSRMGKRILPWTVVLTSALSPFLLNGLYQYFFTYRSDSAAGRLALYSETFQAFLRSPWIGYGTYGRSDSVSVPLGSHSQIFSTLYHTGILGSALIVVAWISLTICIFKRSWRYPALSPVMGLWTGFSFQMLSGELSAASVTVFSVAAILGSHWNQSEVFAYKDAYSWLPNFYSDLLDASPTPWQALHCWYAGLSPRLTHTVHHL